MLDPTPKASTAGPKFVPQEKSKPDDLLAAIRSSSKSQLKSAEDRKLEPITKSDNDPKSNLLGEIRNFDKSNILKKVETNAQGKDAGDSSSANQLPGLLGDLARLVNEQRMAMNPDSAGNSRSGNDSDDCSEDSFDEDDWD